MLSGCSARNINTPVQSAKEPLVLVNPLRDDPDNPSPYNPLIKKFGDIPEVRTYIRLKQKLRSGTPLTVDEAIALFTADLHLYPYQPTEDILKSLKETKKRNEALGLPTDTPIFRYTGGTMHDYSQGPSGYYNIRTLPDGTRIINDHRLKDNSVVIPPKEDIPPPEFVLVHPFKDNPDNPNPDNPLIKKFGDIPEVRTYIRFKQKFLYGIGLNIDEAIELYTAEVHLYPTSAAKEMLKDLKSDKERYEKLGIPMSGPILTYNAGKRKTAEISNEDSAANEETD